MKTATLDLSAIRERMMAADQAVCQALEADGPGRRMEALCELYQSKGEIDRSAIASALITRVVFAERKRD